MRIFNGTSCSVIKDLLKNGLFAGVDIGESSKTSNKDVCTVLWQDAGSRWMIESNNTAGEDFIEFFSKLPDKAHKRGKHYLVLCMDACLSKPVKPHYYDRDCEKELKIAETGLSWRGTSYHKAIDLLNTLPLHGPRKRFILETHPQSNFRLYESILNRNRNKNQNKPKRSRDREVDYLLKLLEVLCGIKADWDDISPKMSDTEHFRDSLMAALVAVAYGRWKNGLKDDYLLAVLDHDGVYWLIDADKVKSSAPFANA